MGFLLGGGGEGYRCWTLWKPGRRGTGTKMTIAFLPWPTSSCGGVEGSAVVLVRGWSQREDAEISLSESGLACFRSFDDRCIVLRRFDSRE